MIITQIDNKVNINLCSWCNRDMGPPRSRGAHRRNCKMNPNHAEIIDKISKNRKNRKNHKKEYETICGICKCGAKIESVRIKGNKTYVKNFCSRKCANSRVFTEEIRKKISAALIIHAHLDKICPICNKSFPYRKSKTCSRECGIKLLQDPIRKAEIGEKISKAVRGKTGGWRNFGGNGLKGHYEGILYQSSWELAWLIYHLDHKIPFRRCTEFFEYEFDGKKSKYYPDFFLEDEQIYVEIKGFMCRRTEAKIKSVPLPIKVLMKNEMKQFLSYAKAKGL